MIIILIVVLLTSACSTQQKNIGETEITKWQFGKRGAVSITYDDGTINQFKIALPVMNKYEIPGTFFIITGHIPGSRYQAQFIGRPVKAIIEETVTIPTNEDNFHERASAARSLGFKGTLEYHTNAGIRIDAGKPEEAYRIMDELYKKLRDREFASETRTSDGIYLGRRVTWEEIRSYAEQGHEFASHTVSHPYLSALDDVNLKYELEKSREDILKQLGAKYTFSATIPYAAKDERVMNTAYNVYPVIRTRNPDDFASIMEEIIGSNLKTPGSSDNEYIKWQCRAYTRTSFKELKSWIDTTASYDNIWQVLILHGVDGIGWEPLTSELLNDYFSYLRSRDDVLWIATFGDVAKYIRERMNSTFTSSIVRGKITVNITQTLDNTIYDIPLTLKTYVSSKWKEVQVNQENEFRYYKVQNDSGGAYVFYQVYPNGKDIDLSGT